MTGHGINFKKYEDLDKLQFQKKELRRAVCVGRVAPVKRIENIIETVSISHEKMKELVLVGPVEDKIYLKKIEKIASNFNVDLLVNGAMDRNQLRRFLLDFEYIFSETPKSTDKAVIEAAGNGLFLITSNIHSLELCGIFDLFTFLGKKPESLTPLAQINFLYSLTEEERQIGRRVVAESTRSQNNLHSTIDKICHELNT